MKIKDALNTIESIVNNGITLEGVSEILKILKYPLDMDMLEDMVLYSEYLPAAPYSDTYTTEIKYLHFLWDALDKTPMSVIANFAIMFRRILAKKMFKKCGDNFIAEENVRFNLPQNIEIGDDVFINRGSYIDAKGGVKIGNSVGIGEGITIFTHSHEEHDHAARTYGQVVIGDFAKLYSFSIILPGVTVEDQAIVAACAIVNKNVENNSLVAGIPAKRIRDRRTNEKELEELNHIWLKNGIYQ